MATTQQQSGFRYYYHILGWVLYFGLNYMLFNTYFIRFNLPLQLVIWAAVFIIFYVNYLILIPHFLFQKRYVLYLALLIIVTGILLTITYTLKMDILPPPNFGDRLRDMPFHSPDITFREHSEPPPGGPRMRGIYLDLYNMLMFIMAAIGIRFFEFWSTEEKHKAEQERAQAKTELSLLKQQVNPHFLFNSLNSIYSLAYRKSDLTAESILKLSDTLRYMLYDAEKHHISLKNELEHIRNFIELQKLRLTDMTDVQMKIQGIVNNKQIEPLLFIPFVENAFKFGADGIHKSFIHIFFDIHNESIEFRIINKVVVEHPNERYKGTSGIGLNNTRRRLEILYPEAHMLKIEKKDGLFEVQLILDLDKS